MGRLFDHHIAVGCQLVVSPQLAMPWPDQSHEGLIRFLIFLNLDNSSQHRSCEPVALNGAYPA